MNTEPNNAAAGEAVLQATVTVTRKGTPVAETYQLTSDPVPLELAQQLAQPKEEQ